MRLSSTDGNYAELGVSGYQYPDNTDNGGTDANWLMIHGEIRDADRSWTFDEPCLLTDEAAQLETWLRGTVTGSTSLSAEDIDPDEPESSAALTFTEPCLAFSLVNRISELATIRIHFSLEARPHWASRGIYSYFVPLRLPLSAITAAADHLARDLATFPPR